MCSLEWLGRLKCRGGQFTLSTALINQIFVLANDSLGAIFRTLSRQICLLRLVQSETVFYLCIVMAITGKISQIKMAFLE